MYTCKVCGETLVMLYRTWIEPPPSQSLQRAVYKYYIMDAGAPRGNKSERLDTTIRGPYCSNCEPLPLESENLGKEWWDYLIELLSHPE